MSFSASQVSACTAILATFGEDVTYFHYQAGATDSITAIWDTTEMLDADARDSGTLTVRVADLSSDPEKTDEVTIGTRIYRVVAMHHADSAGMQDLTLRYLRDA